VQSSPLEPLTPMLIAAALLIAFLWLLPWA
jgi:hypothetical protein